MTDRGSDVRQRVTLLGLANAQGLSITDVIGGSDTADWWRTTVPGPNVSTPNPIVGFAMQVTGLPSGAVVQMTSASSATPSVSVPAVNGTAQFTVSLSPGPWDVSVTAPSGTAAATYTLSACSYTTYLGCTPQVGNRSKRPTETGRGHPAAAGLLIWVIDGHRRVRAIKIGAKASERRPRLGANVLEVDHLGLTTSCFHEQVAHAWVTGQYEHLIRARKLNECFGRLACAFRVEVHEDLIDHNR